MELEQLEQRRTEILTELKSIDVHERQRRHELLDEYGDVDTLVMIHKTKVGESECDSCGVWDKLVLLPLGKHNYEVCKKCYKEQSK